MRFQMSAWLKGISSIRAPSCWKRHLGCPVWPCLCPSMPPLKHFHGTSVPQNTAPSQRLHVRMWSYVLFMCYVWLEAAPLAWRADSRLRCWTSVSLLRPTEASWKCSTQRWSRAQWLSAQLPRPQLAPRPGTWKCRLLSQLPFNLDLKMNWPRGQREQLQRLETFGSASLLNGVCWMFALLEQLLGKCVILAFLK